MDLHPEDLLEREIRGELSTAEQERLEQHARQCAVCRLERQAREDFQRDAESPEADADVARLLAAMAGPLSIPERVRASKTSPMRYLRFVSAAAAVVTITGLAAAARWSGVRAVVMPWSVAAPPAAVVVATAPPSRTATIAQPVAAPVVTLPATEPPAAESPSPPAPHAPLAPPAMPAVAVAASHHMRPAPAPEGNVPAASPVPSGREGVDDAATFFQKANEARQSGDHLKAGALYGTLLNRYPAAPEAHASLALFGRMLLDDGNPSGALQCFDDYLRRGGALREEVMLGRALAFQRIGPRASADEARAWTSLLDAYPGSVHAERARRRLSELERL